MKESTCSRVIDDMSERKAGLVEGVGWVGVGGKRCSGPTEETYATIDMLCARERYFSAIAPAATRPGKRTVRDTSQKEIPKTKETGSHQLSP